VETNASNSGAVGVEAQDEQRHAVALFEFEPSLRSLKSPTAEDAFGLVEVDLPQIGPLQRVVTFEANAGFLVYETRAVSIATTE
jgi:hypothetical protein